MIAKAGGLLWRALNFHGDVSRMKKIFGLMAFGMLVLAGGAEAAMDQVDPSAANSVTITKSRSGCTVTAKPGVTLVDGATNPIGRSGDIIVSCLGTCKNPAVNGVDDVEDYIYCKGTLKFGGVYSCAGCPGDDCSVRITTSRAAPAPATKK